MLLYEWKFELIQGASKKEINPPLGWESFAIDLSFDDLTGSRLELEDLTFVDDGYNLIRKSVTYEGILINLFLHISLINSKTEEVLEIFYYKIDNTSFIFYDDNIRPSVALKIKKQNYKDDNEYGTSFEDYINSITFNNIKDDIKNFIETTQIIVQSTDSKRDLLLLNVLSFQLGMSIIRLNMSIIEKAGNVIAHGIGGVSGPAAAGAMKIVYLGVLILEVALTIVLFIKVLKQIFNLLIPKARNRKVINIGKTFEFILKRFDISISTPRTIIMDDNIKNDIYDRFYLPSYNELLEDNTGVNYIPRVGDYGYLISEFIDIVKKMYNANIYITPTKILFCNENSSLLYKNSDLVIPNVKEKNYSFNLNEYNSISIYQFDTDLQDDYTLIEYKGTSYEVNRKSNNTFINIPNKLQDIYYNMSLGVRKNEKWIVEKGFDEFVKLMNLYLKIFAGGSSVAGDKYDTIGCLMVSNNVWSKPKLLYLKPSKSKYSNKFYYKLPLDHRDYTSAKYFYENFGLNSEFSLKNNRRKLFNDVKIPFGYSDYIKLKENNVIRIEDTDYVGKITKLYWEVEKDTAIISYYIIDGYNDITKYIDFTYIETE